MQVGPDDMSHMDKIRGRLMQGMIMNPMSKILMEADNVGSPAALVSATEDLINRIWKEYGVHVRVTIAYSRGEFNGYWWGPNRIRVRVLFGDRCDVVGSTHLGGEVKNGWYRWNSWAAHFYVDDVQLCNTKHTYAEGGIARGLPRVEPKSAPLSSSGVPYGRVCQQCAKRMKT